MHASIDCSKYRNHKYDDQKSHQYAKNRLLWARPALLRVLS